MELRNKTHAFTEVIPTLRTVDGRPTGEIDVTVLAKATYELREEGELYPARERLAFAGAPHRTPFGVFGSDRFTHKIGADLCVLGTVRLVRPVRRQRATISVGGFASSLQVFGDRAWSRSFSGLTLGLPEPFTDMPIAYERAFGGVARAGTSSEVPSRDNPFGRGFHLEEADAAGKPAPNVLGDDEPPLSAWTDRPRVVGWGPYPFFWGLRAFLPRSTVPNHAHPSLVLDAIPPGAPVRLVGTRPAPLGFDVPRERWLIRACIGGRTSEAFFVIDGVYWWLDADKVVFTRRARFTTALHRSEDWWLEVSSHGG